LARKKSMVTIKAYDADAGGRLVILEDGQLRHFMPPYDTGTPIPESALGRLVTIHGYRACEIQTNDPIAWIRARVEERLKKEGHWPPPSSEELLPALIELVPKSSLGYMIERLEYGWLQRESEKVRCLLGLILATKAAKGDEALKNRAESLLARVV
jgi:hypothetical protein